MKEEVERYLASAKKSLSVAKELFNNSHYEDACSQAYYVMFYSAHGDWPQSWAARRYHLYINYFACFSTTVKSHIKSIIKARY